MPLHRPPTRPRTFVEKVAQKPRRSEQAADAQDDIAAANASSFSEPVTIAATASVRPKRNGSRARKGDVREATPADVAEMEGFAGRNHLPPSFRDQLQSQQFESEQEDFVPPSRGHYL